MKLIAIFYVALLSSALSMAQDSVLASSAMKKIFIEPMALIDIFNGPSLRAGVELPFSKTMSAFVTVGIYDNTFANGCYLKGGIKKYWTGKGRKNHFVDISFFYKKETLFIQDYVGTQAPILSEPVNYTVPKQALGLNVETGYSYNWRRLAYEWYTGVGIRIKTASPSISDSLLNNTYLYTGDETYMATYSRAFKAYWPSLIFGIRVGYMLKQKKPGIERYHIW